MNSAFKCYIIFLNITFSHSPLPWGCPKRVTLFSTLRHLKAHFHHSGDSGARHRPSTKGPFPTTCPARRSLQAQSPAFTLLGRTLRSSFRYEILRQVPPSLHSDLNWGISLNRFLHRSCFTYTSKTCILRHPGPCLLKLSSPQFWNVQARVPCATSATAAPSPCPVSVTSFPEAVSCAHNVSLLSSLRVTWGQVRKITSAFGPAQTQWENFQAKSQQRGYLIVILSMKKNKQTWES